MVMPAAYPETFTFSAADLPRLSDDVEFYDLTFIQRAKLGALGRRRCAQPRKPTNSLRAVVVILEAHDIIFSQVAARLNFNQLQIDFSGILEPMLGAAGNIN